MDSSSNPRGAYDYRDNELKLDPGVSARRNRSSGCKCVFIIILASLASLVAVFIGIYLVNMLRLKGEPHAPLLYKAKSVGSVDPAAVIRPLIDEKQTFDVVATVWLRTNGSDSGSTALTLPSEKAIFTGKIFQGLTLKHKDIHTTINYTVPTEIFKNRDLKDYDLRASFVLVPTSPSFLDNLTSYSSWRNEKIPLPPFRYWPDTGPPPTLQDKAIDSFGVSIGLLQFFGIRSRCGPNMPNAINAPEHTSQDKPGDEDSDDESDRNEIYTTEQLSKTTKGKPVLESHPYIISHSFLRAVDMTKLYDRKAYNQAHKRLKINACGLASDPPNYDWTLCDLGIHENIDTRLQLRMAEEESGNKSKHWAYAPYLSLSKSAWTPKDLILVPVNREDCTKGGRLNGSQPFLPDQDSVEISWEIVYSGRSHLKFILSEAIIPLTHINMTDLEEFPQEVQHISEMIQGLRGNRLHKDSHPRRIFFRAALVAIINFIIKLVDIRYWHACSSTIGISKFATILFAVITLGNYILPVVTMSILGEHFLTSLLLTLASLPLQLSPFLMLKVIWRMEFGWNQKKGKNKWTERGKKMKRRCRVPVPSVHFVKATHDERASDRLDARTPWTVKLSLFVSCYLAYFFFSPSISLFLIPPLGLSTPQIDNYGHRLHLPLERSLIYPGLVVGSGLQLWFNHQSCTFAGKYKLSAILKGIILMLDMLHFSTRLLGHRVVREGFSVHDLVNAFLVVVWCYQAVMLPKVKQEVEDGDEVE